MIYFGLVILVSQVVISFVRFIFTIGMLDLFLFDLGQQQNHEKKREISSREFRNRFPELIRDRLDREAILSPLGSSLGLQCL